MLHTRKGLRAFQVQSLRLALCGIAFLLCMCHSTAAFAQPVLRVITVCDRSDDIAQVAVDSSDFVGVALRASVAKGQLEFYYAGNRSGLSRQAIFDEIERCPATDDDAILLFYCGHGFINSYRQPLILPENDPQQPLYLKDILVRLKNKACRQKIAVFDCCQVLRTDAFRRPASIEAERTSALCRSLFFEQRNEIPYCVISSGPGEVAVAGYLDQGKVVRVALFSSVFRDKLYERRDVPLSWDDFTREVARDVAADFESMRRAGVQLGDGARLSDLPQNTQTVTPYLPIELKEPQ